MSINVNINGVPYFVADQAIYHKDNDYADRVGFRPGPLLGSRETLDIQGVRDFLDKEYRFGIKDDSGEIQWFDNEEQARMVWEFLRKTQSGERHWELVSELKPNRMTISTIKRIEDEIEEELEEEWGE